MTKYSDDVQQHLRCSVKNGKKATLFYKKPSPQLSAEFQSKKARKTRNTTYFCAKKEFAQPIRLRLLVCQ